MAAQIGRIRVDGAGALFRMDTALGWDRLPKLFGTGDILVVFFERPPYVIERDSLSYDGSLQPDLMRQAAEKTFSKLVSNQRERWQQLSADPFPEPGELNGGDDAMGKGYMVLWNAPVTLRKGGARKVSLAVRLAVIDAGQACGNALDWYSDQSRRAEAIGKFPRDGMGYQLGPPTVQAQEEEFQSAVGRLLAYMVLHEICHCTGQRGHPTGLEEHSTIELSPVDPRKTKIGLLDSTITRILRHYETEWCQPRHGGVALRDLPS
jgi:hypothetical protein